MIAQEQLAKLRWQCRRGMLELDVLLGNFLENHYQTLSTQDQQLFVQLLNCNDQDLFGWLLGHTVPADPIWLPLIEKIRQQN